MWISKSALQKIKEAEDARVAATSAHISNLQAEVSYLRSLVSPPRDTTEALIASSEADAVLGGEVEVRYTEEEIASARLEQAESDRLLSGNYDQGND